VTLIILLLAKEVIIIINIMTELVRRPLLGLSGAVQVNVNNYTLKKLTVKC